MVNFTHESMTSVMTLVHFSYLSSVIPESPTHGVFVSQLIRCATFRKMHRPHTDLVNIFDTYVTYVERFVRQMRHMSGFHYFIKS